MKNFLKFLSFSVIFMVLLSGCKSKKPVVAKERTQRVVINTTDRKPKEVPPEISNPKVDAPVIAAPTGAYADVVANYINTYSVIAKQEMATYGIPASITLAQGILESGAGRGDLSRRANNHFGIKCHSSWTGDRVYHDDDELQECFRKYNDPATSYRDHSLFLSERSRYKSLFSLHQADYKGWAKGLRKAGYATDPKYPNKLISIIERYNLRAYDTEVLNNGGASAPLVTSEKSVQSHIVEKGETLYAISRKYKMTVAELRSINGLNSNDISIGQMLYLQPQ